MTQFTLEAWCTPTQSEIDLEKKTHVMVDALDHTAVHCFDRDNPASLDRWFCPWGQPVDTGSTWSQCLVAGSSDNAYCIADQIAGPDCAAGLKRYAISGVCHQATNRFLYIVDRTLPQDGRPKGYLLSRSLYGTFGSHAMQFFFDIAEAKKKCGCSQSDENANQDPLLTQICSLYTENSLAEANNGCDLLAEELTIVLRHYLPEIKEDSIRRIREKHMECLEGKAEVFQKYGFSGTDIREGQQVPAPGLINGLTDSMNNLAFKLYGVLLGEIGKEDYFKLTGTTDFCSPIDLQIAAKVYGN
jgi:hypothetical protein